MNDTELGLTDYNGITSLRVSAPDNLLHRVPAGLTDYNGITSLRAQAFA